MADLTSFAERVLHGLVAEARAFATAGNEAATGGAGGLQTFDAGDRYELEADVPGVPRDAVRAYVADDGLQVEVDAVRGVHRPRPARVLRCRLPPDADADDVQARVELGVLRVSVGKVGAVAHRREVAVR